MNLKLTVEQSDMDAFARLLDAALKGSGVAVLPDVNAWMNRMQAAIAEVQKPKETA